MLLALLALAPPQAQAQEPEIQFGGAVQADIRFPIPRDIETPWYTPKLYEGPGISRDQLAFNAKVYDDALGLSFEGLVTVDQAEYQKYRTYRATPDGMKRADELRAALQAPVVAFLDDVVRWVRSMSFQDLVRAIYRLYPEMRANSVFEG